MNIDVLDSGYTVTADGKRFGYTTLDDLLNGLRGLLSEQQQLGLDLGGSVVDHGDGSVLTTIRQPDGSTVGFYDDGWREWEGELRPGQAFPAGLNRDTQIQAVLRDGTKYSTCHAWTVRWHWSTGDDYNPMLDVVRYRVVKP